MRLYNSQLSRELLEGAADPRPNGIDYEHIGLRRDRPLQPQGNPWRQERQHLRVPTLELDDGTCLAIERDPLVFADGTGTCPTTPSSAPACSSGCSSSSTRCEAKNAIARFWLNILGERDEAESWSRGEPAGTAALCRARRAPRRGTTGPSATATSLADISLFVYIQVAGEGGFDLSRYRASRRGSRGSQQVRAASRWTTKRRVETVSVVQLGGSRPPPRLRDAFRRAQRRRSRRQIRRLSAVQLDSIRPSTAPPAHALVAGRPLSRGSVSRLLREGRVFEYWAHEACLVPVEDYPLFNGMEHLREPHWWGRKLARTRR